MLKKIVICATLSLASLTIGQIAFAAQAGGIAAARYSSPDGSLHPGEVLGVDQAVRSPNGGYTLVQQPDGNLVLYNPQRQAVYSTNTANNPGAQSVMQPDGNFVIYSTANKPIFHTNTANHPSAQLYVQDDGNVVIRGTDGAPIWSTGTTGR